MTHMSRTGESFPVSQVPVSERQSGIRKATLSVVRGKEGPDVADNDEDKDRRKHLWNEHPGHI